MGDTPENRLEIIQRRDTVDHARRIRYYGSMIDKSILDKGAYYDELPDVYIIYISETDLLSIGKTVYPVKKALGDSGVPYDDGNYVIFANVSVELVRKWLGLASA